MLGTIAILIIIHSMYSALRWRLFLQGSTQEIGCLPFDVLGNNNGDFIGSGIGRNGGNSSDFGEHSKLKEDKLIRKKHNVSRM